MNMSWARSWLALTITSAFAAAACGGDTARDGAVDPAPPAGDPTEPAPPGSEPARGKDYLIVAPDTLAGAASRFAAYRAKTGHAVEVGLTSGIFGQEKDRKAATAKIREWIKERYDRRVAEKPFFVLLLGDATDSASLEVPEIPAGVWDDPAGEKVVSDNVYADMDGDEMPDLALGRIAVASDEQAEIVLSKTERYETTYETGAFNRKLNMFASTAGFGDAIDGQIEKLVFDIVDEVPYDYDITLTYAKQSSPWVFVPERFSDKVYERIDEGSLMVTYVGHGHTNGFASLEWNGKKYPILDTKKVETIDVQHKSPIMTLIACLTGKFTEGESLSERLLNSKKGPVAIYSSTEVSSPYANAVYIREVAQTLTVEKSATVGELFARAKRRMITNTDPIRQRIDEAAGMLFTKEARESLRRSHLHMYTLFGDPAARIPYTRHEAKITAPAKIGQGASLAVSAAVTGLGTGQAVVTLETSRRVIAGAILPVPPDGAPGRDAVIEKNYAAANERTVAKQTVPLSGGALAATLAIPAALLPGDYYVKVYADDGKSDAIGSAKIAVGP